MVVAKKRNKLGVRRPHFCLAYSQGEVISQQMLGGVRIVKHDSGDVIGEENGATVEYCLICGDARRFPAMIRVA
jgi:hypothetical protein